MLTAGFDFGCDVYEVCNRCTIAKCLYPTNTIRCYKKLEGHVILFYLHHPSNNVVFRFSYCSMYFGDFFLFIFVVVLLPSELIAFAQHCRPCETFISSQYN